MIVTLLSDPILRASIRRAALPDEDVVCEEQAVLRAIQQGFPRLIVYSPDDLRPLYRDIERLSPDIPCLALTHCATKAWEVSRRASGFAMTRIDDAANRLRVLMRDAAGSVAWVDQVFANLSRVSGSAPPPAFRGFARRVLEFPARYTDLYALSDLCDLSPGGLKGRFRRRGLESPSVHLRWLRALAAGHLLADQRASTLAVAYRLGISSDGNFCRWLRSTTGLRPTQLRDAEGASRLLVDFGLRFLDPASRNSWMTLDDLFLRRAA